jgi:hypothetical protein
VHSRICVEASGREGFGEWGEEFETLLGSHVAGVEEDDLCVFSSGWESQLLAEAVGLGWILRVYLIDVYPVGEEDGVGGENTFRLGPLDHLDGDAGDAGERLGEGSFEGEREVVDGTLRGKEAQIEGGVHLKVLNMKPRGRIRCHGDEERYGGAEEGWFDCEHDVRRPEGLAEQDGEAAEHEGCEVGHPLEACGLGGDVEWATVDGGFASSALDAVGVAVVVPNAPCGIVWRRGDNVDVVAAGG